MIDKIEIIVEGGRGGGGLATFRREKYIPFGGPDGGDGGKGGDVFFISNSSLVDLDSVKQKKKFRAASGHEGGRWNKHGKKGVNLDISVPIGTVVSIEAEAGRARVLADLTVPEQKVLVAKGGKGGLGNVHFATPANQAPRVAGRGRVGEECRITLELKLITDVCIIGYPNSGKSALLSAITGAQPRIADYPFTTRQPALGVIQGSRRDFVVAEMPALVEDAHVGKGLGYQFLRHTERAKLLVYLLDGTSPTIVDGFTKLNKELALYKTDLCQKAGVIAVNKVDLPEVQSRLLDIRECLDHLAMPVLFVSAISGQGVIEFTNTVIEMVEQVSQEGKAISPPEVAVFHPKPRRAKQ